MIDPILISKMIGKYRQSFVDGEIDYASNTIIRSFPRGLDAELVTLKALEVANLEATKEYEREHVTPYIYMHPEKFRIAHFIADTNQSLYRWTLDTKEDLNFLERLLSRIPDDYSTESAIKFLEKNPEIIKINSGITQKPLTQS
jgi:spore coat polysaccharide biosynthesis protein SpsF